ncbi:pseudouridine synthase [Hymenobacter taeanensis]|uniref:Pseudouridine synthase n=1 Tax=Hymenobacter taeanensis TaxID=2735321 RepID=A0A6M6BFT5_9BACT|nr:MULTISPECIES: pseudouridine synthase [Hymenobacter]QJX46822.1 pseudouridine synthase [Hymenobacter taeanensis]UOQ80692.1 pseudouridine synthase [Hymenobacter sp. 5414T-23]
MGKQHNSGETPGRSGRSSYRPSGSSSSPEGFRKSGGAGRNRDDRPTGGNPRFGDAPRGNSYGGPKKFGNSGSGFGGPKKFNSTGGNGGFNRGGEGRPSGGGSRPYGNREYGNDRPQRSFDRDAPRRFDDRREGRFERDNDRRDERPARAYEPKANWPGQPYRQEGKPTVPRGGAGERNRKFNKKSPFEQDAPQADRFQPREEPAAPTRDYGSGPDREIRPARPFDFRGRPDELDSEERAPRREGFAPREERSEPRREGGFSQRPYGERKEGGFGGGSFGEKRTARPSSFNADRRDERPARPGSFGDRDNRGAGEKRFNDRREERPARPYGDRSERTTNKRTGRELDSNQAGKRKWGEVAGQAPDYKNLKFYEEDKTRGNKRRREEDDSQNDETRLNRYIANAGICSRREADSLIAAGEIKVNGEVITEMGYKVKPTDTVQYGKTNLNREKLVYVLLNKPKDFITTTEDPEGRRTVMELVAGASKERIFPVGRLDRNTTGLILFTNDGEVAQKLSHPSHRNKKIYQVELDKPLTEEHLGQIAAGLELEDGRVEVDDVAVVAGNPHFVGIEIHIGRNRIVRRIFEHLGYDVVSLDRVQYAGLTKKDLPRGKWRFLSEKEVIRLKYFM